MKIFPSPSRHTKNHQKSTYTPIPPSSQTHLGRHIVVDGLGVGGELVEDHLLTHVVSKLIVVIDPPVGSGVDEPPGLDKLGVVVHGKEGGPGLPIRGLEGLEIKKIRKNSENIQKIFQVQIFTRNPIQSWRV